MISGVPHFPGVLVKRRTNFGGSDTYGKEYTGWKFTEDHRRHFQNERCPCGGPFNADTDGNGRHILKCRRFGESG